MNNLPENERFDVKYKILKAIIELCDILLKILRHQNNCRGHVNGLKNAAIHEKTQIQGSHFYHYIKSSRKRKIPDRQVIMYVNEVVQPLTTENIGDAVKDIILKRKTKQYINGYIDSYKARRCIWHPDPYLAQDANNQVEQQNLVDSNYEFRWRCNPNQNRCNCMHNGNVREFHGRLKSQQCRVRVPDPRNAGHLKRCTRMTIFGIGICWQHLRKYYKLFVAPAEDENGVSIGKGVYPYGKKNEIIFEPEFLDDQGTIPNPNWDGNNVITRYDGELVRDNALSRRYGDCTGTYTIADTRDTMRRRVPMDGALYRGLGTLVNHLHGDDANAIFGYVDRHNAITGSNRNEQTRGIFARKPIRASGAKSIKKLLQLPRNERNEILVDYGDEYFMDDGIGVTELVSRY